LADLSITIQNAIGVYGPAPSMRWGVDLWGTLWGDGAQFTEASATKLIENGISSDSTVMLSADFMRTIANTFDFIEDLSSEDLSDGIGYSYVFSGNASNAENRVISTYSTASAGNPTYSSQTAGTTVWS
jgi:hypothetical protein